MSSLSPLDIPGVALVTGGGSGIGKATCLLLAREGVRGLVVADLNSAAADAVKSEATNIAVNPNFLCITIHVDVTDEISVSSMIEATANTFGRLDYAVNCAGIGLKKAINETTAEEWNRVIGINLTAVFTCIKAETVQMLKQKPLTNASGYQPLQNGAIVNIASLGAIVGLRHSGAYTAAKHGVLGITRTAALDYPDVKINAIVPGYIKTPLTDAPGLMRENALDKVNNWTPLRRFGLPEEIAEGIVWLLSSRSNFTHGSTLTMDGGYLAQ